MAENLCPEGREHHFKMKWAPVSDEFQMDLRTFGESVRRHMSYPEWNDPVWTVESDLFGVCWNGKPDSAVIERDVMQAHQHLLNGRLNGAS